MTSFDQVYAEYFHTVYSYALRLTRDPALAEEVTQETFFKALKSIDRFRGDCQLRVWLCQIAKNTYYSLLEKRDFPSQEPPKDWPDPMSLEERFADRETALAVHRVLHQLEEPFREVFWLRALGELPFAQIAGLFGKSESWARVTYHRARLKLLEKLKDQEFF